MSFRIARAELWLPKVAALHLQTFFHAQQFVCEALPALNTFPTRLSPPPHPHLSDPIIN